MAESTNVILWKKLPPCKTLTAPSVTWSWCGSCTWPGSRWARWATTRWCSWPGHPETMAMSMAKDCLWMYAHKHAHTQPHTHTHTHNGEFIFVTEPVCTSSFTLTKLSRSRLDVMLCDHTLYLTGWHNIYTQQTPSLKLMLPCFTNSKFCGYPSLSMLTGRGGEEEKMMDAHSNKLCCGYSNWISKRVYRECLYVVYQLNWQTTDTEVPDIITDVSTT